MMHHYAKRFFAFAQGCTPKIYYPLLSPIREMIEEKRSVSDKILSYAKKKGYLTEQGMISNSDAAALALYYAQKVPEDLDKIKKKLEKLQPL